MAPCPRAAAFTLQYHGRRSPPLPTSLGARTLSVWYVHDDRRHTGALRRRPFSLSSPKRFASSRRPTAAAAGTRRACSVCFASRSRAAQLLWPLLWRRASGASSWPLVSCHSQQQSAMERRQRLAAVRSCWLDVPWTCLSRRILPTDFCPPSRRIFCSARNSETRVE